MSKTLQGRRRVLPAVLGLVALMYSPKAALAQVAAGSIVESVVDPQGVRSSSVNRHDPTRLTLPRLIDLGRLDDAREKLREQFAIQGELPRLLFFEAMILYKERQYLQSIQRLARSLTLSDGDPDVYKLAGLNLVSLGRRDLAGPYFEAAVELAPRDFMARYYLGLHQLSDRRYDRAETILRDVINLRPDYLDAYILLGVAKEQRGKEEEAIRTYHQAIELAEQQHLKRATPFLYLARLLISLHRHEQSLAPLKRAVEIDSTSSEARTLLGQALTYLGRYDEALPVLMDAAALQPRDKTAHYLLMRVYKRLGKKSEAAREMQLFRELNESGTGNRSPDDPGRPYGRRSHVR
ncbi:MAG: tetratricopeptide repeat protein [Luteitalea sp.]|nr:tetratricopeptide repeat protein [Luteitalea sp.]